MVVVVNMLDVAKTHGLEINLEKLQAELGCPVVGIVASRKKVLMISSRLLINS